MNQLLDRKVIVNCGCGKKYSTEMINLDFISNDKNIIPCNLLKRLPFANSSVDWIYNSHFLEHLTRAQADAFLRECRRVLKPKGGIRIVVPDLEDFCISYLESLKCARADKGCRRRYDYSVIQLIDQMVRTTSGGEMMKYAINRLSGKVFYFLFGRTKIYKTYHEGMFSNSGELHKWMYDSYSLFNLLTDYGFKDVAIKKYGDSNIPGFKGMKLEVYDDGSEYKPHSVYIEAHV